MQTNAWAKKLYKFSYFSFFHQSIKIQCFFDNLIILTPKYLLSGIHLNFSNTLLLLLPLVKLKQIVFNVLLKEILTEKELLFIS